MDTSTHIAFGIGFAGLAYLDPAVAADPVLANAVMAGTILGSNAPDFDYAVKLVKGKAMYIEHHRGISHSIPALFIWAILLSGIIQLFHPPLAFFHLFGWTLFAAAFHVFIDIFNMFGTQGGRPFTKKWLALNAIPLFDPFMMFLHIAGFLLWALFGHPALIFTVIYVIIGGYMAERLHASRKLSRQIQEDFPFGQANVMMAPTMKWSSWKVTAVTDGSIYSGDVYNGKVNWVHSFKKEAYDEKLIQLARTAKNAIHFLKSTDTVYPSVKDIGSAYEVKFIDYRFRTGQSHFPFMAIVIISKDHRILSSCTGWIYQEKDAEERMEFHHPLPESNHFTA